MKSLMIQGTSSGAGKTILVTALCRIFPDKGYLLLHSNLKTCPILHTMVIILKYLVHRQFKHSVQDAEIVPELNPILLKPRGNYIVLYFNGKYFKKMHAKDYYSKFVKSSGLQLAINVSLKNFKKTMI